MICPFRYNTTQIILFSKQTESFNRELNLKQVVTRRVFTIDGINFQIPIDFYTTQIKSQFLLVIFIVEMKMVSFVF